MGNCVEVAHQTLIFVIIHVKLERPIGLGAQLNQGMGVTPLDVGGGANLGLQAH